MSCRGRSLSLFEVCICSGIWLTATLYASYHVYQAGKLFDASKYGDDFGDGWFLGYKKDMADNEWHNWTSMIISLMPWFLFHIVLTEITRLILIEALPVCYIMVTNLILLNFLGYKIALFFLVKDLIYFFILFARSYFLVWILNICCVLFLSVGLTHLLEFVSVTLHSTSLYFVIVSFAWKILKSASFSFEFLKDPSSKLDTRTLFYFLGYSYYLPLFFLGPLMLYNEFKEGITKPFQPWTTRRFFCALLNILRYIFWMVVLDLFLHFFYIHALEFNLLEMKEQSVWHLNGLSYLLAAFFCVKYTAVYGLTGALAAVEGYEPPPRPRCVFYVYRNSQIWRTFDVGFYRFIKRYLYVPILNDSKSLVRRFFAAAITFTYVFLWHGLTENIFWWSLLNFLQVSFESVLSKISRKQEFQVWFNNSFSERNRIRLKAAYSAPLYVFFLFANSFFYVLLGGYHFFSQFFEGNWTLVITLNFFSYCFCVTAIHMSEYVLKPDTTKLQQY